MFCTKCGNALSAEAKFCPKCGAPCKGAEQTELPDEPTTAGHTDVPDKPVAAEQADLTEGPAATGPQGAGQPAADSQIPDAQIPLDDEAVPTDAAEVEVTVEDAASRDEAETADDESADAAGGIIPAPSPQAVKFCPQCGKPMDVRLSTCPACGANAMPKNNVKQLTGKKKRSKGAIIGIAVGAVAIVAIIIVLAVFVIPEVTATPQDLLDQGRYEDAYNRADDSEKSDVLCKIMELGDFETAYSLAPDEMKSDVLLTNLVAVLCVDEIDNLKDSSSFVLRDVWFDRSDHKLVMCIEGANSYSAQVTGYRYYTFDSDDNEYQRYASVSDLEDETIYRFDTYSEKIEKYLYNAAREEMRDIIADDDNELDSDCVDVVNSLYEDDMLDDVELLEEVSQLYPSSSNADAA